MFPSCSLSIGCTGQQEAHVSSCSFDSSVFSEQVVDGRTFVLSDNFCKTTKFLVGLAMEVPCVAYS